MPFSVLMSVYAKERPEYLREALQSLANQTLKADEVVLVEDGPLGEGLKVVIEDFRGILHIKSVPLPTNQGLAAALNVGLKHCSHELVARMDSDDISLPHRFEKQVAFMQENVNVSASSAWIEEFDQEDNVFSVRILPVEHKKIYRFAKTRNPLSHPVSIFKKSDVLAVGGYPDFRFSQDYALWSLMLYKGYTFANMNTILLKMRAGSHLMGKRGLQYLINELKILQFQRRIGFIGWYHYLRNCCIRIIVRLSPDSFKKLLYKFARGNS